MSCLMHHGVSEWIFDKLKVPQLSYNLFRHSNLQHANQKDSASSRPNPSETASPSHRSFKIFNSFIPFNLPQYTTHKVPTLLFLPRKIILHQAVHHTTLQLHKPLDYNLPTQYIRVRPCPCTLPRALMPAPPCPLISSAAVYLGKAE